MHELKYSRFHADLLASGGDDCCVFLRDGAQTPVRVTSDNRSDTHSDYVRALEWLQVPSSSPPSSSPSTLLVTGSWDKTLRTWSLDE